MVQRVLRPSVLSAGRAEPHQLWGGVLQIAAKASRNSAVHKRSEEQGKRQDQAGGHGDHHADFAVFRSNPGNLFIHLQAALLPDPEFSDSLKMF